MLRDDDRRPPADVYLVCTTGEEMGGIGAAYASRTLPGEVTLALDVGPAESEYDVPADSGPVIAYADDAVVYDKAIADRGAVRAPAGRVPAGPGGLSRCAAVVRG